MTSLLIKNIAQKDNHSFTITWNDNLQQEFRLNEVQKHCPCAKCANEMTGQRIMDVNSINEDVKAISIRNVGRYALQIRFTSGCSTGIYHFELLRKIGQK